MFRRDADPFRKEMIETRRTHAESPSDGLARRTFIRMLAQILDCLAHRVVEFVPVSLLPLHVRSIRNDTTHHTRFLLHQFVKQAARKDTVHRPQSVTYIE